MKITKEQNRPAAYFVQLGARCFWFTFEPLKNNINWHPRRQVKAIYKHEKGGTLWARSFVVVLNYESESEAAQEIAQRIAQECDQKKGKAERWKAAKN